jgi:hypothetical protein
MIMASTKYIAALVLGVFICSANAALVERLDGLAFYDDVTDLTWAQDAYATSGAYYDVKGYVYSSTIGGIGGWRLASVDVDGDDVIQRCSATVSTCFDNEFSYLYFGNGISVEDPGVFSDVRTVYWTDDRWYGGSNHAYSYHMSLTSHGHSMAYLYNAYYGWAVHDGDVADLPPVPSVPIPATFWLFGSALGLLGWIRRERR